MDKPDEDKLYQAVVSEDQEKIVHLISQGANPNKTAVNGKTCLGEAAYLGNETIVKLLIDTSKSYNTVKTATHIPTRKRPLKSHKRKHRSNGQCDNTVIKYKNLFERKYDDYRADSSKPDSEKNQGYFVFIHSEGSSSDEGRVPSLKYPLSPQLTPSQAELEWDEDIVNVAPVTSEDETWSSMYKWYAAILESTGAAIASASVVTYGIDQQDAFTKTALHYAAFQGHYSIVQLLLHAGCKVDITAGDGLTPLHVAVIRNHVEISRLLVEAGSHVDYKTHEKMTPLHFASSRGYLDLVKVLVNNGANLEARDTNERTALYLAAGRGHVEVVKCLILSGASVNCEEIHGYTPLCEAVWKRFSSVVEVLLAFGARITHSHKLLDNAIIQRQVDIVKMITNLGGGINLHNDNGDTPLLLSVRLSQPAIARILLEKGANVNGCNNITGASALHVAVESIDVPEEFEELLMCLLEYNINMNIASSLTDDTPLNRALLLQKDHAAVILIRYGADVNASDLHPCGLDNLIIASGRLSFNLASMLIKAGHHIKYEQNPIVPKPGRAAFWLYHACKQPLSLSDLCRIKIRQSNRNKFLYRFIDTLPLPKSLKRFLMMEDEGF